MHINEYRPLSLNPLIITVSNLTFLQAKLAFERLEISKEFHPFISGPNGATAKRISEDTGARVNIPPMSLMKNEISVAGDKDAVAKAVAEIKKIHATMVWWGLIGVGCQWRS